MFKKLSLLTVVAVFSNVANAGLFDSNDFKCGRDDAIKALADYIRNDASGLLQSDYLTKERYTYDKPIAAYQSKLNNMVIEVTNVSTSGDGSYGLNCSATLSLNIPQEAMDVVSSVPYYLRFATGKYGKINNDSVIWSGFNYSAKLADNKKDVIFSNVSGLDASDSMFNLSVLAENKDHIINTLSQDRFDSEQSAYTTADRELNAVWKALPDSARNAMKKEQVAWVKEKATKCGKLSDANSETINIKQRIGIYQCQTKMTNERSSYLGSSEE
jgi:uncharacterized protein YecT (DUF1311 family)